MNNKKVIGDYNIISKIGSGQFATVYLGKHISDNSEFRAIKVVNKSKLKSNKLYEYLQNEIVLLKSIKHDNIIKYYANFVVNNTYICIVLEYCNEGDLQKYMLKKNKDNNNWIVDENMSKYFLKQLVDGLYFCFKKNIIHRDIKPANLLLYGNSDVYTNLTLKITDFGFAKILNDDLAETMCGSPLYMAPEIIKGDTKYDYKSDIWSVGIIFWELLTGSIPDQFKPVKNMVQLLKIIETQKLEINVNISKNAHDLLFKLLNKNYKERIDYDLLVSHVFLQPTNNTNNSKPVINNSKPVTNNSQPIPIHNTVATSSATASGSVTAGSSITTGNNIISNSITNNSLKNYNVTSITPTSYGRNMYINTKKYDPVVLNNFEKIDIYINSLDLIETFTNQNILMKEFDSVWQIYVYCLQSIVDLKTEYKSNNIGIQCDKWNLLINKYKHLLDSLKKLTLYISNNNNNNNSNTKINAEMYIYENANKYGRMAIADDTCNIHPSDYLNYHHSFFLFKYLEYNIEKRYNTSLDNVMEDINKLRHYQSFLKFRIESYKL